MKKAFLFLIILSATAPVSASELIGHISTRPDNSLVQSGGNDDEDGQKTSELRSSGGGMPPAIAEKIKLPFAKPVEALAAKDRPLENKQGDTQKNTTLVKGISFYPAGTLFRDSLKRVYVFDGIYKKHLKNFDELKKYAGQPIFDLPDNELAEHQTRPWLEGDLIRKKGTQAVYVIENGQKKHVKSLRELARSFFGQEIRNIEVIYW